VTPPAQTTVLNPSSLLLPSQGREGLIPVPPGSFWRKLFAFSGRGYLVAVGSMDPGNWATGLAGGAAFGYELLSVIILAKFAAMFLQVLAAKLGLRRPRFRPGLPTSLWSRNPTISVAPLRDRDSRLRPC
jgi:manganese transport protein